MKNLKLALKIDPNLYDAYYGLGTFHYWLGAKSKIIRYLFFYQGDRHQGIDELEKALKKGKYTNIESKFALTLIYYNERDYNKALFLNHELYGLFPSNPSSLYMRSRIFEKQENWNEAKIIMQKLLHHLDVSEYRCVGYKAECHYRIAYYDFEMGNFESGRNHCLEALKLKNQREPENELEGPLETFQQILKQTKRLYAKLNNFTRNGTILISITAYPTDML
jgi:tetratricopeptide (TPR) repeat protein